ncbi:TPR repeat-containing protein [Corallococcus coralloides DSM 2259]|uniref:TPR repeat-containing protein n=1 Tax=Corallococcus coralloides (strain ATCC 25202 / DSM 2259 / NBRC 100086 / M2) TaxID=1144275 RepID=H8MYN8_CORCM|nr:hypothetical protein [Corallococcus coralloides]AFE04906.1 TPR repeat-containing protein [Corallococcus coralloides DSM 2259]
MEDWRVREKAYSAARQTVEYHREQAALDPEVHLPALIDSLMAQSRCLRELYATDAAIDSATEAVDLLRSLAQARPDAFLPRLATELHDLGRMQAAHGSSEAALAPTAEAVAILRKLAEVNPDAFLPQLATSLRHLGTYQGSPDEPEAGLASTAESVAIFRQLAAVKPDAFLPELVKSLSRLADRQSKLGQDKEQRASRLEEVAILRKLAEARPGEFRPALAKTLGYIGRFDRGAGWEEPLAFLAEAVAIGRQLVAEGLDTYVPTLALHLNELSRGLSWPDQAEASLALAEEALAVSWLHFPANPADFHRLVEMVLDNLLDLHQVRGSKPEGAVLERINAFKAWRPGERPRPA